MTFVTDRGGEALANHSLTEEERAQIEERIAALEIEHHDLDDVIARLSEHPDQDQLQLRRFKKRKLVLKDSISRLKILLVPDIVIDYYARERLSQIWRMYYYYGYFKPLVAQKLGLVLGWRQIIPALLILILILSLLLGRWFPGLRALGLLALTAYLLADATFAWQAGRRQGLAVTAYLALVFPTLHFSYGLGFLRGLLDFFLLGKKGVRDSGGMPLSR